MEFGTEFPLFSLKNKVTLSKVTSVTSKEVAGVGWQLWDLARPSSCSFASGRNFILTFSESVSLGMGLDTKCLVLVS